MHIPQSVRNLFCFPSHGNEQIKLAGLRFTVMGFQNVIVIVQVLF